MRKPKPIILRSLIFITLVSASVCFAIGLSLSAKSSVEKQKIDNSVNSKPTSTTQVSSLTTQASPASELSPNSSEIPKQEETKTLVSLGIKPHIQELNQEIPLGDSTVQSTITNQDLNSADYGSILNSDSSLDGKTFIVSPQFQGKIIEKIPIKGQQKVIALTFDDGPWPKNTLEVLDILKKNNIKATFFWVGQCVKNYPKLAQAVVADGHAIGNHTWSHSYRQMNEVAAGHEIDDTAEIIYKTTGVKTFLFRPPGGIMKNGVADYAKKKNYVIVMWSDDPMDYRPLPAEKLVANVIHKAQSGRIILMHDGGGKHSATVKALPEIIAKLKQQGYKFVTVPELLNQV